MALPAFDEFGNLPAGEHTVSWPEFEERYGYNPVRASILRQIKEWLVHMRGAGCRAAYIDGSFICETEAPGDYDACWDATGVNAALLDSSLLDQTAEGRRGIKR